MRRISVLQFCAVIVGADGVAIGRFPLSACGGFTDETSTDPSGRTDPEAAVFVGVDIAVSEPVIDFTQNDVTVLIEDLCFAADRFGAAERTIQIGRIVGHFDRLPSTRDGAHFY
jgi:hypothetical protein